MNTGNLPIPEHYLSDGDILTRVYLCTKSHGRSYVVQHWHADASRTGDYTISSTHVTSVFTYEQRAALLGETA